jgi:uncharacterized protein
MSAMFKTCWIIVRGPLMFIGILLFVLLFVHLNRVDIRKQDISTVPVFQSVIQAAPQPLNERPRGAQSMDTPAHTNRLIHEKSPYLLQHAHNPVDWYPWGPEAFARAKAEDKPIFLSVGYSTCYWCHVMEQESFENEDVAALMNETVIAIKVDREERPDIDAIYMTAVQTLAGQGGWPMSVFLTPEGKPFYGGTYFPPDDRYGRPGFTSVLTSVSRGWTEKREQILQSSEHITRAIAADTARVPGEVPTAETLEMGAHHFAQQFDANHGGFGGAPKFPRSHSLSFLLRQWTHTGDAQTLEMVTATLDAMARGGLHDQLGGGFHRYSTDAEWLVPHFEKMLYDQALLAKTYLEAYQATGETHYADVAEGIFQYVLRDMRDPGGAFYSAEDAGEVGHEGVFYVWRSQELDQVLGENADLFKAYYGVTPAGNFEQQNILHVQQSVQAFATARELDADAVRRQLAAGRATLLRIRDQRPRPHLDDKVLTDWNGLMIGALAYGGRVLNQPVYTEAAARAADFVLQRLRQDGQLMHRYREGEVAIHGMLEDYAFVGSGLFELYQATLDPRWLQASVDLTIQMIEAFWDQEHGGLLMNGTANEQLIAPTKELYDGALPSGNSVAALNIVRLGQLTQSDSFKTHAAQIFRTFSSDVKKQPSAYSQFLQALDFSIGPTQEIVIAGDPASADTQAMLRVVHQAFLPRAVVALHATADAEPIEALVPFILNQTAANGRATAYVCENYQCQLPTQDLSELQALLSAY